MGKGSFFGAPVYSLAGDLKIVNEYHPALVLSLIYNKFFIFLEKNVIKTSS